LTVSTECHPYEENLIDRRNPARKERLFRWVRLSA